MRILLAACACFGERGYGNTTNREIAERAGITPALIYQYFEDQLDLYVAAAHYAEAQCVPVLREAVSRARTARAALRNLVLAYGEVYRQYPSLMPILSGVPIEIPRHPEIGERMVSESSGVVGLMMEAVQLGVKTGEIAASQSADVLVMFLACTIGLSVYASLPGARDFFAVIRPYAQLLDGTLLSRPSRSRASRARAPQRAEALSRVAT